MKNIILFGAGRYGKAAAKYYGIENVKCFVDNNSTKWENFIDNVPVISAEKLKQIFSEETDEIIITVRYYRDIEEQLKQLGISRYKIFSTGNDKRYYPANQLVFNPYEDSSKSELNEEEYNMSNKNSPVKEITRKMVDEMSGNIPLFDHIEIETINRCNGVCSFCPINALADKREKKIMPIELFQKIVDELAGLNYTGKIALFSNNEPLLDERIIDFYKYGRSMLPNAYFFMFTNGTLLTLEKFIELIPYLDELVIDNYNQELKLIPNSRAIKQYCESHEYLKDKVTIVLRKPNEILSTRGGDAPNRKQMISYPDATCVLPFKQMIVRPDGKVSLCCNDPLGKNTLGDLAEESILEVWYGKKYGQVRKALLIGRSEWEHCIYCDVFSTG